MTVHMTIELSEADEAQLKALAEFESVSAEEALSKIVSERLNYDAWFRAEVQKGLDAFKAGDVLTHEEVMARSDARRAELLARSPHT
jgi:predicted transcriptional regulator